MVPGESDLVVHAKEFVPPRAVEGDHGARLQIRLHLMSGPWGFRVQGLEGRLGDDVSSLLVTLSLLCSVPRGLEGISTAEQGT